MRIKKAFFIIFLFVYPIVCFSADQMEKLPLTISGHTIIVEIAQTPHQRKIGLMYRKSLPENQGMLFVYRNIGQRTFWMKNTFIPLSIAFIDTKGIITEIVDMTPLSEQIIGSTYAVRYALEVNQGLFKKLGISTGDQIKFPKTFTPY